jgi:hypothetical protein
MIAISTAERFAAWEAGGPLRVTAGVDTSPPTFAALRLVEMLARAGPVELTAVRIVYPIADCPRLGLPLPRNYFEVSRELEAALRRGGHCREPGPRALHCDGRFTGHRWVVPLSRS